MSAVAHLTLDRLRAAARAVAEAYALDLVVLFGSAARDGFAAAGDVDVGVRAAGTVDRRPLYDAFARRLGTGSVDVVDLRAASPTLQLLVARDAVPLYERDPDDFAEFWSLAARRFADARKFREAQRAFIHDFLAEYDLAAEPSP